MLLNENFYLFNKYEFIKSKEKKNIETKIVGLLK